MLDDILAIRGVGLVVDIFVDRLIVVFVRICVAISLVVAVVAVVVFAVVVFAVVVLLQALISRTVLILDLGLLDLPGLLGLPGLHPLSHALEESGAVGDLSDHQYLKTLE